MTEKEKYNKVWKLPHYNGTDQRGFVGWVLAHKHLENVIDFGCGNGRILEYIEPTTYTGVDFSEEAVKDFEESDFHRVFVGDLTKEFSAVFYYDKGTEEEIIKPQWEFQGICTDVMEHIQPEDIEKVLENIRTNCKECFFSIALFPHNIGKMVLHPSVFPPETWVELLERFFDIKATVQPNRRYLFVYGESK